MHNDAHKCSYLPLYLSVCATIVLLVNLHVASSPGPFCDLAAVRAHMRMCLLYTRMLCVRVLN